MIWATRRNIHVDRTACAWLIRRFVDADAEFVFVDDPDEVPAEAMAFDMRGAELGHREGRCSFESILARYELSDPALVRIGRIVHEADIGDEVWDAPEAPGLDALIRGLARQSASDDERISRASPVYDALYALWSGA
ncbi:MAG: chromate resistance protein ChrB domain-containing protein [Gaiellales bacterium]